MPTECLVATCVRVVEYFIKDWRLYTNRVVHTYVLFMYTETDTYTTNSSNGALILTLTLINPIPLTP